MRRFTRSELDHAIALRETGLAWLAIAERLDCDSRSLQGMVWHHRRGRIRFFRERGDEMAALAEQGVTVQELRRRYSITCRSHVHVLLRRRGIDSEMLRLYRA